ncbi:unnamed protein product [Protopolystoma xenopodis]|uniref:Secreted protein n=1 Tax=Protopolystoma xenopodis TaxID=117903 RepID=A0A448XP64_9PLAT|nr:unnamed protein product [Protopolystoma xenopodis]
MHSQKRHSRLCQVALILCSFVVSCPITTGTAVCLHCPDVCCICTSRPSSVVRCPSSVVCRLSSVVHRQLSIAWSPNSASLRLFSPLSAVFRRLR